MKNENDLRVKRTRTNLRQSLLTLLKQKTLTDITVKEICTQANCSRNAFYMHFPHKEALYEYLMDDCIRSINNGLLTVSGYPALFLDGMPGAYTEKIILSMQSVKETLLTLIKNDAHQGLYRKLSDIVFDGLCSEAHRIAPKVTEDTTYLLRCRFLASGIAGFSLDWLQNYDISTQEAARLLLSMQLVPLTVLAEQVRAAAIDPPKHSEGEKRSSLPAE